MGLIETGVASQLNLFWKNGEKNESLHKIFDFWINFCDFLSSFDSDFDCFLGVGRVKMALFLGKKG